MAFPPLAQYGIYLSLRKLPARELLTQSDARDRASARWKDSAVAFELLQEATLKHETILFAGGTGSGKTTL